MIAAIAPGPARSGTTSGDSAIDVPSAAASSFCSVPVIIWKPVNATMIPPAICRPSREIPK